MNPEGLPFELVPGTRRTYIATVSIEGFELRLWIDQYDPMGIRGIEIEVSSPGLHHLTATRALILADVLRRFGEAARGMVDGVTLR